MLGEQAPTDYWLANLPRDEEPERVARLARLRWKIELDYKQLKGELGLDQYEGRSPLRATVLSPVACLVRVRLAAGCAVRSLAACLVLAGLPAAFAVRNLAACLVDGRPAARLTLRHPPTRLILSRVARLATRPRGRIPAFGRYP